MQDALQAAVKNMNGAGSHELKAPPIDAMGLLMTVVPKLLQGSASSGEMVESPRIINLSAAIRCLRHCCCSAYYREYRAYYGERSANLTQGVKSM